MEPDPAADLEVMQLSAEGAKADVWFGPPCIRPTILPFLCSWPFLVSMFAMWVYVFYGLYVGPAKLHCGATPPYVMVLFIN